MEIDELVLKSKIARKKPHSSMGIRAARRTGDVVIYIVLAVMCLVWICPFIFILLNSFRVESSGIVGYVIPQKWGIANYQKLFKQTETIKFGKWFCNTLIVSLVVTVLQTLFVLCMAYTLSRLRFNGRKFLMNFMLVLGMFPGMLTMIIIYRVLADMGMTQQNAIPGYILVYVASSGMGYYVSKGFFDTISKSLDEAARVDGANRLQVLFKVILPLSKPIVIYTALTAFMGPWGDFVFASYIAFNASDGMNVAVGLNNMISSVLGPSENFTTFCAGGVCVAVPVAVLFLILQKYYVEGVTGGAVKG